MSQPNAKKLAVVTGGAGFIGSHLAARLLADGYDVISLDNYVTGRKENHTIGVTYRDGHTKDIATHITETPDVVFHLGEYARTEQSFDDIALVWDSNKTGTFAVLEFCRARGCKIIYAGSSTKFADGGSVRDQSPYSWTKATNTELVKNYADWYGVPFAIVYFYNVYGPRELAGKYGTVIQIFTELYQRGEAFTITSPGTQVRHYTHVQDIVEGITLVAESGAGDGYGIGSDTPYSVLDVAKLFEAEVIMTPERPGNRMSGDVENTKIKALGWQQQHQLPDWIAAKKAEKTVS